MCVQGKGFSSKTNEAELVLKRCGIGHEKAELQWVYVGAESQTAVL